MRDHLASGSEAHGCGVLGHIAEYLATAAIATVPTTAAFLAWATASM